MKEPLSFIEGGFFAQRFLKKKSAYICFGKSWVVYKRKDCAIGELL
ncbi:hypothetical protein LJC56_02340 [Christensenellaceae bacterium OttesenSCG-928-K19]|nr:hypothetical protein [Christensenellaceae bacterium OttesenSCG-928-K19]